MLGLVIDTSDGIPIGVRELFFNDIGWKIHLIEQSRGGMSKSMRRRDIRGYANTFESSPESIWGDGLILLSGNRGEYVLGIASHLTKLFE